MTVTLTAARVRELLIYDPETGAFIHRVGRGGQLAGSRAGTQASNGYRNIYVDRRLYREHRLAWLYTHGEWPAHQIDHINGVRDDNRLANLREATPQQNHFNTPSLGGTSRFKGVSYDKERGRWAAYIKAGDVRKNLGRFHSEEDASAAYQAAASRLHGEFARAA